MQFLEDQSRTLEAQNAELERQVLEREAELVARRQANQQASVSGTSPRNPAARKAELNTLVHRWLATVSYYSESCVRGEE